jgi:hypothetical protein
MGHTRLATIASFAGGRLASGGRSRKLAAGHDAAVQMIDTSVGRVHQHEACIADNNHQDMGRSRGGLTSKIHAVVDTNCLTSACRDPIRQTRCQLSGLHQTRFNPNLAAC